MNEAEIVGGIWPSIRDIGAMGGLVSAAFLLWDRWMRYRPYARFLRLDGSNVPEENRVILRIYNPGNRLMLAHIVESTNDNELYLSADDETFRRSDIAGIMTIPPGAHVDADAERQDAWKALAGDELVHAVIRWRYAQAILPRHWKLFRWRWVNRLLPNDWRTMRIVLRKDDFDTISPRKW